MIDKAWRAVTPLTIHSCFKRSGFQSPNLVDVDDTLTEFNAGPSLWKESDEDESEELHKLRNFFLQNHVDVDILQASFVEEKSIDKHKEKIFSASSSRVRKRLSKGNFPRLEQCLVSWMRHCRGQNIPMGGPLLKEKAKAFAKELGIEFSASEG
ncbi:uncharacterized protein TNCV_809731 [Trichonephila clavipes]|uniref:HTH CENPB-type domain-containing protein n=1 Tax=Trichonephila clavipes TaxID=2585209 RepID=A0A8X6VJR4_TRICX|nr:uncharacterized protein TNCV_809731 [Trichonephila clavipes]